MQTRSRHRASFNTPRDIAFREYTFVNPAMFHARVNPDIFKGTAVEAAVDDLLKEQSQTQRR